MNIPRFEALLAESGLDGVIASSLENVSYLSGARIVTQRLIPDRGPGLTDRGARLAERWWFA